MAKVKRATFGRGDGYEVHVGNEHYCCTKLRNGAGYTFYSEKDAERAGKEWMREMVAQERTAAGRRAARESYYFEVHEIER